jgi:hypothetical protein
VLASVRQLRDPGHDRVRTAVHLAQAAPVRRHRPQPPLPPASLPAPPDRLVLAPSSHVGVRACVRAWGAGASTRFASAVAESRAAHATRGCVRPSVRPSTPRCQPTSGGSGGAHEHAPPTPPTPLTPLWPDPTCDGMRVCTSGRGVAWGVGVQLLAKLKRRELAQVRQTARQPLVHLFHPPASPPARPPGGARVHNR